MADGNFITLHEKLNELLAQNSMEDFDESELELNSVSSLHAKADALCAAHGGDPSNLPSETLAQLHPKLDQLLEGNDVATDSENPDTLASVEAKLDAIRAARGGKDA